MSSAEIPAFLVKEAADAAHAELDVSSPMFQEHRSKLLTLAGMADAIYYFDRAGGASARITVSLEDFRLFENQCAEIIARRQKIDRENFLKSNPGMRTPEDGPPPVS